MHLKQLKIAGFKSFVDPTIVPFSSQLVGVVGPNGCGKSNIIDAVRWVMGESSAKTLRGESMTDVIFNGSSNRKPVGQASVELVFDNSMGRLGGQYASYQEISVKRVVTRDGESAYYLNNSRCRRRDITDVFLGTGAGSRSYSIIGQDTISHLIEARPEELRGFLEEAAGVSKYKERRRETLQRLSHTKENLSRVVDIRDELDKHLHRLEHQAKAATVYKELKEKERSCKAEILALKWQDFTEKQKSCQQEMTELKIIYEKHQANLASYQNEKASLEEKIHQDSLTLDSFQNEFYQLKTEVVRLEESIEQQKKEQVRLTNDKHQIKQALQDLEKQKQHHAETIPPIEQRIQELTKTLSSFPELLKSHQDQIKSLEDEKIKWNDALQQTVSQIQRIKQDLHHGAMQIEYLNNNYRQTQLKIERLSNEQSAIDIEKIKQDLSELEKNQQIFSVQAEALRAKQTDLQNERLQLKETLTGIEKSLNQVNDEVKNSTTQQSALQAAQMEALRGETKTNSRWKQYPRFVEIFNVPSKWIRAIELILDEGLEAVAINKLDDVLDNIDDLKGHSVIFLDHQRKQDKNTSAYPKLAEQLELIPSWLTDLNQIFIAEDFQEAIKWLPNITDEQSIITPEGYWLGKGWLKLASDEIPNRTGLLKRKALLEKVTEKLNTLQEQLKELQQSRDHTSSVLAEIETKMLGLQQELTKCLDKNQYFARNVNEKQQALAEASLKTQHINEEKIDLTETLETFTTQRLAIEDKHQHLKNELVRLEEVLTALNLKKSSWDELSGLRKMSDETRDAFHQTELEHRKETLLLLQVKDNIAREELEISHLTNRLQVVVQECEVLSSPEKNLESSLQQKVTLHQEKESALISYRQALSMLQHQVQNISQKYKQEEQEINLLLQKLQDVTIQEQTHSVRAQSVLESANELEIDMQQIQKQLGETKNLSQHEEDLTKLQEKIKRLGAINLIAIEEYQSELERKTHLDNQYQDLMEALNTLELAIAKMDKETELRLKETFDQVNTAFQSLFPRLFAGGRAMLELTCDNLLDAGILVMAQPPGKRNSSIHLLSGGEKAMTAVALVFAIFQLNPSPFCMLDEVDAPLDDLNVRRFCDVVKEMSEFVQFLFITHNKVTMELAEHLIGVTMREPGVSRIVAVNVEEALSMAE